MVNICDINIMMKLKFISLQINPTLLLDFPVLFKITNVIIVSSGLEYVKVIQTIYILHFSLPYPRLAFYSSAPGSSLHEFFSFL